MKVIEIKNISKRYKIVSGRRLLVKTLFFDWFKGRQEKDLWALKNINFEVNNGEAIGIIGENGSGKTTLLRILSGVTIPTTGVIKTKGRVSSLLELGAGFHPDLTGRENIYLNGSILGLKRKGIDEKFEEIVEFSGLKEFIDTPLKNYSSGMYLRLGFAVAMSVSPDILLIDEVLSVGDETFQKECIKKIKEFKDAGKTIIFVSHDLDMVLNLCDRVFLLSHGEILQYGKPADVVQFYLDTVGKKGVAILKKSPLDVIFNQGKFSLYWQGRKITKGLGGFSSILSAKRWYNSTQAEWQIKSKEQNKLVVQGKWLRLPVIQIWELDISKNSSLCWQVKTEAEQEDLCEEEQINLMLSDGYQEWFVDKRKENFPQIQINSTVWEDVLFQEPVVKSVSVRAGDLVQNPTLPSICFETQDKDSKDVIKLFNSDYQASARVLQCSNRGFQDRHDTLNVEMTFGLPDLENYIERKYEQKIKEIISNEKELSCIFENNRLRVFWRGRELPEDYFLVKRYIENKLETRRREEEERKRQEEERKRQEEERKRQELEKRTLQKDSLKLIFEDGRVRLFWKDIELTKGAGLYTSIYYLSRWYLSTDGTWTVEKPSSNQLIAKGSFKELSLSQTWSFNLQDGNLVSFEIKTISLSENKPQESQFNIALSDAYSNYFTPQENGNFPNINEEDKYWHGILKGNWRPKTIAIKDSKDIFPNLALESTRESTSLKLYNADYQLKARILQLTDFNHNFLTKLLINIKNIEKYLNSFITLEEQTKLCELKRHTLRRGPLKLIFEDGKTKISWRGVELTKGFHAYSSLYSNDKWFDSFNAKWGFKKLGNDMLIAEGRLNLLPITQVWKLSIEEFKVITWDIDIISSEDISLEQGRINLMLSDTYKEWFISDRKRGFFPEIIYNEWIDILDRNITGNSVGVKSAQSISGFLPHIVLKSQPTEMDLVRVTNTDFHLNARVIQFLRLEPKQKILFSPGRYQYLSCKIYINEK